MSEFNKICDRPFRLRPYVYALVLGWTAIIDTILAFDIHSLLQDSAPKSEFEDLTVDFAVI